MSQVKSSKFGVEGLTIALSELANAEAYSFEDGSFEVYGEDAQGREGSTTVDVNDIAAEALAVIEALREKEEILNLIIKNRMAVIPEYEGGWHVTVFGEGTEPLAPTDRLDLRAAVFVAKSRYDKIEK